MISVGSKVVYRLNSHVLPEFDVTVLRIERVRPGYKYGVSISSVPFSDRCSCVFDLDNGHWCFGYKILDLMDNVKLKKFVSYEIQK